MRPCFVFGMHMDTTWSQAGTIYLHCLLKLHMKMFFFAVNYMWMDWRSLKVAPSLRQFRQKFAKMVRAKYLRNGIWMILRSFWVFFSVDQDINPKFPGAITRNLLYVPTPNIYLYGGTFRRYALFAKYGHSHRFVVVVGSLPCLDVCHILQRMHFQMHMNGSEGRNAGWNLKEHAVRRLDTLSFVWHKKNFRPVPGILRISLAKICADRVNYCTTCGCVLWNLRLKGTKKSAQPVRKIPCNLIPRPTLKLFCSLS